MHNLSLMISLFRCHLCFILCKRKFIRTLTLSLVTLYNITHFPRENPKLQGLNFSTSEIFRELLLARLGRDFFLNHIQVTNYLKISIPQSTVNTNDSKHNWISLQWFRRYFWMSLPFIWDCKKKTRIIKLNPYLCLLELSGCYMVVKLSQAQMSHLLCWAVRQNHQSRTEQCEKILSSTVWGHSTDSTVDASTKLVTCLDQLL